MPGSDPCTNNTFLLEIDGIQQAAFSEVMIEGNKTDPILYRNGNEPTTVRKLAGLTVHRNVSLKWGITDSVELHNWRKQVVDGQMDKACRNCAVVCLDAVGNPAARWEMTRAWPCEYHGPNLNATGNEVAIESLVLCCEGVVRTQ